MGGRSGWWVLAVALVASWLAGCGAGGKTESPRQSLVEWPEQALLFVGDERIGTVRVFSLRGAPVQIAQLSALDRTAVRDLQLDKARGQLWVLGVAHVHVYDARRLVLQQRVAVDANAVTALRLEAGGASLIAANGAVLGRIEAGAQLPRRRLPAEASPG